MFFSKKLEFFFKIGKHGKFAVECVSNDFIYCIGVLHYNVKYFCNKSEFDSKFDEKHFLKKKNAFFVLKGIFNKIGRRKIYRW